MSVAVAVALAALAVAAALVTGSWAAVAGAAAVWPVYFLGLDQDWWGSGLGDGWEYGLVATTLVTVAVAVAAVLVRRLVGARDAGRPPPGERPRPPG